MELGFENRRRHERVTLGQDIVRGTEFTGINLSESGMLLGTSRKFYAGYKGDIELVLGTDKSLRFRFEVMRVERAQSVYDSGYRLGVQFLDLRTSQQLELREFIASLQA